ncbi:glycosyltransferase [Leptospira noumeaensis]|uniref:Glycosyltransferase n=1 Tax=Leptospira noumeaensis TaxID=2484964 RepID=A0A4R9HZP8_9LEPT|nr:glycosyltransferase family 2 protein [Leptospira noumeaensis]TGK78427.1 glycosyltransferase [Leptospira noumeaensis]
MSPKLSIITIVLNNKQFFEYTLKSVREQSFKEFEYIVIDGGSTDGTLELIKKNRSGINYWVSEPDRGIYDAMNKGLKVAKGEWIIYLNAGDRFADRNVLTSFFKLKNLGEVDFVFGNWYTCNLLKDPNSLFPGFANYEKGAILHQSVIYKRKLHNLYGNYLITPKLIISDYVFFLTIPKTKVFHFDQPISINDNTGVSTAPWSYKQKLAIDFVFGRITALQLAFLLLKFHIPRFDRYLINYFKRNISWFKK